MENINVNESNISTKKNIDFPGFLKFLLPSIIGVLLLMVPFKYKGDTTIFVGLLAELVTNAIEIYLPYIAVGFMGITAIGTLIYKLFKPEFIEKNNFLKGVFNTSPVWILSRLVGFILGIMVLFNLGPEWIWSEDTGGLMLFDLIPSLFTLFFFAGFFLPFLTDFGLLEFIGVLLTPIMRPLFKLPGRSSIDCVASWVGDGTIGVTLTNNQYLDGYYTAREASVIATTFSAVSITFSLIVLKQVDLAHMFGQYYLTILLVGIVNAIIMPRIPPLSNKPDSYYTDQGKDLGENIPEGFTTTEWGLQLAIEKAESYGGIKKFLVNGFETAFGMWLEVLPIIMAFGSLAVIITDQTNLFQILGKPFLPIFKMFNVPEAAAASQTVMVGFADMFLPSVLAASIKSEMTRFIIATLSVTQLIYLSESGAVMLGTDIPISLLDMFIIFIERTLISLPIIIIIAKILF